MNSKLMYKTFYVACLSLLFVACELQEVPMTTVSVSFQIPNEVANASKDGYKAIFSNISSGRKTVVLSDTTGAISALLEEGVYDIQLLATKTLSDGLGGFLNYSISGIKQKVNIVGGASFLLDIPLAISKSVDGFVIKEIYYTGCLTTANKSYNRDQFVEIYNNSDSVLYADGISIAESMHSSGNAVPEFTDYPNDLMVDAVYTVPGDGKTYPVQPRTSLLIASMGINHSATSVNPNSPSDMSKADFEWFDEGTTLDQDVPEVPNLVRNYCYSNTIWTLFTTGVRAFVIFRTDEKYSDFINNNKVSVPTSSGSYKTAIKVSNSLIIDGVELTSAGTLNSKSLSTTIDLGYTYCTGTYIGKSVRRKVKEWKNGKAILQDTNNSFEDFIPNADPKPRVME